LAVPTTNSSLTLDEVTRYSAVKLFVARAQSASPVFSLQEGNAQVICGICARLDGLPLAIELAAARIKLLSPTAILDRLENGLKLLSNRTMGLPARQQTMRSVVEWSYDLLSENEKDLFARLSVFSGGMTVEAVEALAKSSDIDDEDILDLVESLIDKNLLLAKTRSDGNIRLRMLEVIREFAGEMLENSGSGEMYRHKHAEYFFAIAEAAEPYLQTANAGVWLNRLEEEHNNLRAAIHWLFKNDAETGARLAASIRIYLINRSHLTEGRKWLETGLNQGKDLPTAVRFKLLNLLGWVSLAQGEYSAARRIHEENLARAKTAGNQKQIAESMRGLGAAIESEGDYASARKFHEEGLMVHRELNDEFGIAASLNGLGSAMLAGGDVKTTQPLFCESLAIFRRLGNESGVCYCLMNLGEAAYLCKDYETSKACFAEVLNLAQILEYKDRISFCLDGFAALAAEHREWRKSARLAGAAEHLRFTIGYEPESQVREFRSRYLEKVRHALGEVLFTETIEEGRFLKLDDAIGLTNV
jgi:non-specific serine/threonine protein kinase